ncbi:MAG: hypothetical protein AAFZ07_09565 [Actinomycetota bacterium]
MHPAVDRSIHVRAQDRAIDDQLGGYAEIMGRRARALEVRRWTAGDWCRLDLPGDGVHPWELHNLAYWLLEVGDVVVTSGPGPGFAAYHLVRADHPNDLLEGWTDTAEALTVHVPGNDVIRPDPDVPAPALTTAQALRGAGVPTEGWIDRGVVAVMSEDPGHDLNPSMSATKPNRAALRSVHLDLY